MTHQKVYVPLTRDGNCIQIAPARIPLSRLSGESLREFIRVLIAAPVIVAVVCASGCESSNPRKANNTPPPAAIAPTLQPAARPKEPAKPSQSAVAIVDPVEKLIEEAEHDYQAGQSNYEAGHLEAAKSNFDHAVSILMQGPVDVRSDERLQREFDKIVDGVHSIEMVALKEGDGFTEQKLEPAPIDEANAVTFPVDPAVKAKAEAELRDTRSDLPLVINDYVASYINFFSSRGRGTLVQALQRSGRYRSMIERILKEEDVPQDLIYLAQAESGFHPLAVSRVGARGMWQFMHYTAPGYGLQHDWWVDDRQDPEKSTRAAARYLKDLYKQFGDWYLAMAAYNSGAGNVQRAVQRTGYADFWELYKRNVLPAETKNYVPIIVAMTIMAKNRAQYGLTDIETQQPDEVEAVKVDYAVDLRLVAEAVDASVELLSDLNPSLIRLITPKNAEFELRLPAGSKQKFLDAIQAIPPDKRILWRYHKVVAGDTLAGVAKKYHTTAKSIAEVNNLDSDEITPDTRLVIPVTSGSGRQGESAGSFARQATRYKVRKGDTVLSVADDFGVPPENIRRWNRIKGNNLRKGRVLLIHKPVVGSGRERVVAGSSTHRKNGGTATASASTASAKTHTVTSGETLYSIASHYNVSVAALQKYNGALAAKLHAGDVLIVKP